MKLIVATHNAHKTEEIAKILGDLFDSVTDLTSIPELEPPEENGTTFLGNAGIKALAASERDPDAFILADDSGLKVDALNGHPGIYSARFAGGDATDADNREKLLFELRRPNLTLTPRTARFVCALAVAKGGKIIGDFEGTVEGEIIREERGENGFGYDPLFVPEGHAKTFAELGEEQKNEISHRARALQQFREWWLSR